MVFEVVASDDDVMLPFLPHGLRLNMDNSIKSLEEGVLGTF